MDDVLTLDPPANISKPPTRQRDRRPNRRGDKKTTGQGDEKTAKQGDPKIKTAVHLSKEAFEKLGAACVIEKVSQSHILEHLIKQQLTAYVVYAKGDGIKFSAGKDRSKTDDQASKTAEGSE
jgi:hypothetical protein